MEWLLQHRIDAAFLAVAALSVLVGLWRGFVFELLSLAGWVVAWIAAGLLGPELAPHLPIGEPGQALNRVAAYAVVFLVVLVLWSLVSRFVSALVKATPLRPLDRLLGALFGIARAAVVVLVAAIVISWTPAARSAAWRESLVATWVDAVGLRLWPQFYGRPAGATAT